MRGCIPYHIKGLLIRSLTGEALNTKTKLDLTKLFYWGVSQLLSVRCKDNKQLLICNRVIQQNQRNN